MRKQFICVLLLTLFQLYICNSQVITVEGRVIENNSNQVVPNVKISIKGSLFKVETGSDGRFYIADDKIPEGEQILLVSKKGFISQKIRILINKGQSIDLDPILIEIDTSEEVNTIGVVTIEESELENEDGVSYSASDILQSSQDVFFRAAAFDFGSTFFRIRGLDNSNKEVYINGIKMNRLTNGRALWDNWGGLNDAQRNREFSNGMKALDYGFGSTSSTTNIKMRASQFRFGGRISITSSNRSYQARIMASVNSGITTGGWAYSILLSRRFGQKGSRDGTFYDSNSFFLSVEKKLNEKHSINLTGFYTPIKKGGSTAITNEVKKIKGVRYNPLWGFQNEVMRNSKSKEIKEPVLLLNHYWHLGNETIINTNFGFQYGSIGNTRIDSGGTRIIALGATEAYIGGARNPFPNYYQRLPSYFLRDVNSSAYDHQLAYLAEKELLRNGQLNWKELYMANKISNDNGGNSIYVLQEDRSENTQFYINSIFKTIARNNHIFNGKISYRNLKSENYALIKDLLGGNRYLDVDYYAEGETNDILTRVAQSDLKNRNRTVIQGDRYKYNYNIMGSVLSGFGQIQLNYVKYDFYLGARVEHTIYQRNGLYENGNYPGDLSYGLSTKKNFTAFSFKGGVNYKFDGRHFLECNIAQTSRAPTIRNTFVNPRQNNKVVNGLKTENLKNIDLSYFFRNPRVKARVTGYFNTLSNQTNIKYYFSESVRGKENGSAFLQEVLTDINSRRFGVEMGIELHLTSSLKIKGAASIGENVFTNNPNQYFSSDDFTGVEGVPGISEGVLLLGRGRSWIKNYHVSGGPERAYQIGLEYSSPDYWWGSVSCNYFSNSYMDISTLRRSDGFLTDHNGNLINSYNKEMAAHLLQQQNFEPFYLVNAVSGKSWRIRQLNIGLFVSVNNLLGKEFVLAGFESSRYADYRKLIEEDRRENPVFGPRYLFGGGTSYYLNLYVRF